MAVRTARFLTELRKFAAVGLDSAVLIYHLEDTKPYSDLSEAAFAAIAAGVPRAVLSTVSVTALLVRPFAKSEPARVDTFERFLLSLPNAILRAPDYATAKEAARLRARYGIRTPDALLVAAARTEGAEALVTNDASLRKLKAEGLTVLVLDDYV